MPPKPDPGEWGSRKDDGVNSRHRRPLIVSRDGRNKSTSGEESRYASRVPRRRDNLVLEKDEVTPVQESSSDVSEDTNQYDVQRQNRSQDLATENDDDDLDDQQSANRHTRQESVPLKASSRPLAEPLHFGLESGNMTRPGRQARDFPPKPNPSSTLGRHNKEDSGYGSSLYQSPVTSPLAPTRVATAEALKQTVSARDSTQSCLSKLSQLFAQIKVTGFADCKTFIENRPMVLREDGNLFLREAALAHHQGDTHYARACVHRGLLIRKCSRMDSGERSRFLHNLASGKQSTVSDFLDDFDDSFEAMKSRADKLAAPEVSHPAQMVSTGYDRRAESGQQAPVTTQTSTYSRAATDPAAALHSFSTLQIGHAPAHSLLPNPLTSPSREERHGGLTASRTSQPSRSNRGSRDSFQSEIEIRGTEGEAETLDPRYRQPRHPGQFFVVGKVFAVLWHENVGRSNQEPGPDVKFVRTIQTDNSTIGRYGERIFSHIRRMVVVRRRYGYCWCVAINTYSGKGVSGKRRANVEDRSHTIVHDSTKPPQYVAGEKKIVKEPIAVIMTSPETLHVASRLNYAKVHTVEHNVKVMDVGMVHPESMAFFEAHWQNEVSRK